MRARGLWPLIGLLGFIAIQGVWAAEVIPPAPAQYFNDYAGVVSPGVAQSLNAELEQFERDTSNQILVVIYPKMQTDSSIEDYTVRVAQAWGAGQKARSNGAVLFVFAQEHQLYIETGYGLEGALPDALCKQIIDDEIVPHFKQGDFDAGLTAGVHAMMAAAKGEYKGTGSTVADKNAANVIGNLPWSLIIFVILIVWSMIRSRRHVVYGSNGQRSGWSALPWWMFLGGGFGGGGGRGGGGWGGGFGGGGFSGGGGGFGGGGAGGSW
jgi:uncharacterized protein